MAIRFHFDEHITAKLAQALRQAGIDVTTTPEVGLRTRSDDEQLEFATQDRRVFVTHDEDFLIMAAAGYQHAGIVFCAQRTRNLRQMIEALVLIHAVYSPEEMENHVEYI